MKITININDCFIPSKYPLFFVFVPSKNEVIKVDIKITNSFNILNVYIVIRLK